MEGEHMFRKLFLIILFNVFISAHVFAAGNDSGGGSMSVTTGSADYYKDAEQLIKRAKKQEEKGKADRALKLYTQAYDKLVKVNEENYGSPDVLNYLGFTLRKQEKYAEAEKFYLAGLKINPNHNGINEYLGELYVKTNRKELALQRLEVLKNCNCEEYQELKEVIDNN